MSFRDCDHQFKSFKEKEALSQVPGPNKTTTYYQVRCVKCGISLNKIQSMNLKENIKEEIEDE